MEFCDLQWYICKYPFVTGIICYSLYNRRNPVFETSLRQIRIALHHRFHCSSDSLLQDKVATPRVAMELLLRVAMDLLLRVAMELLPKPGIHPREGTKGKE